MSENYELIAAMWVKAIIVEKNHDIHVILIYFRLKEY